MVGMFVIPTGSLNFVADTLTVDSQVDDLNLLNSLGLG